MRADARHPLLRRHPREAPDPVRLARRILAAETKPVTATKTTRARTLRLARLQVHDVELTEPSFEGVDDYGPMANLVAAMEAEQASRRLADHVGDPHQRRIRAVAQMGAIAARPFCNAA